MSTLPIVNEWTRGDTVTVARVEITADGDPVDLTDGYEILWQLRRSPDASSAVDVTIDDSDAATGVLVGKLTAVTTADMAVGTWVSDVQVTGTDGVLSSQKFGVKVLADVSRAAP